MAIQTEDNLSLFSQDWVIKSPRAVIALIHGQGEHSTRYQHVADFYNQHQIAVMAMDLRGHGQSDGPRGHTPSLQHYMDDITLFLGTVRETHPDVPVFLYGHSLGGNLSLNFILRQEPALTGAIITSPWIQLAFQPPKAKIMLGKMMRFLFPTFTQSNELDTNALSRNKKVVEAYNNDPLVHSKITAACGVTMLEAADWLHTFEGEMTVPTLLHHGDADRLTSHPASKAFAARLMGDITFRSWAGGYHELHNEPEQKDFFAETLQWIDSKLAWV